MTWHSTGPPESPTTSSLRMPRVSHKLSPQRSIPIYVRVPHRIFRSDPVIAAPRAILRRPEFPDRNSVDKQSTTLKQLLTYIYIYIIIIIIIIIICMCVYI